MVDRTFDLYQKIFSASPVGMMVFKSTGQCVEVNSALCHMLALTKEQILALDYTKSALCQEAGLADAVRMAKDNGAPICTEVALTLPSGITLAANANVSPFFQGNEKYLLFVFNDLCQQKKTEKKLHDREFMLHELVNNMTSGMAVYDVVAGGQDFIFKDFNRAAERIEGVRREEVLGRSVADVFPGVKKFGLWDVFRKVWETGVPVQHPVSLYRDDRLVGWRENYVFKLRSGEVGSIYKDVTRSKQLEFEQQRLIAILEGTSDFVSSADLQGNITYMNAAGRRLLGWQEKDVKERCIPDVHPVWAYELVKHEGIPVAMEKGVWLGETALINQDGIEIPVSQVIMSHRDQDGEVEFLSTIMRDISERKRSEEEIVHANALLNSLVDSIPDLIFYKDYAGTFLGCNRAFAEFVGREKEAIVGFSDYDFFDRDLADFFRDKDKQMLNKGASQRNEEWVCHSDGRDVLLDTLKTPYYGPDGKVLGLIGVSRDITDYKKAEQKLLQQASAIENAAEEIFITDSNGIIEYVNPAFERITGYTAQEVIGKNQNILKSRLRDEADSQELWQIISSGKVWSGRLTNRRKDGGLVEMEATISPIFDKDKKIIGYVSVKRDISEQLRMESQLRESQKLEAIGTLAGGIAHDFNNILAAIIGYTDLAMLEVPSDSMVYTDLNEVRKAGNRAKELVKQILTFSRRTEEELTPQRIQVIVKEVLKLLRASIPSTIEIHQHIDGNCRPVLANPTQLHQVIMNLCTNAYQAMRESGGILLVTLKEVSFAHRAELPAGANLPVGRYLLLEVGDNGAGMDSEILPRIFEPYFTTKEKGEGTGLGLSVVHGIIESHHGKITVSSKPGQGTTFQIYLPLIDAEAEKEADIVHEAPCGAGHVLFVDDEQSVLDMGKRILENLGYTVTVFQNSPDALHFFKENSGKIDLVLTDMTMPKMTGAELAKEILAIRKDIPVLLCSGFSDTMNEATAKEIGIRQFLLKPVSKYDLAVALQKELSGKVCLPLH